MATANPHTWVDPAGLGGFGALADLLRIPVWAPEGGTLEREQGRARYEAACLAAAEVEGGAEAVQVADLRPAARSALAVALSSWLYGVPCVGAEVGR